MKILFQNRKESLWVGGDMIQLRKTLEALKKLNVDVDFFPESYILTPEEMKKYDIVHLWNFSMMWTKYQLWVARKHKIPVVCSMIYHEGDNFIPYPLQQVMLNELSAQIYLTESEKERVKRRLTPVGDTYVIPNGIDEFWFKDIDIPKERIVLTVGRIEPNKGQLAVARACEKMKIPYICVGECEDEEYRKELLSHNALLIGKKSPEELIKYYAKAKVFALVSKAEIFPLTVMEAMAQNCQIVLTDTSEWKPDVVYAKYGDENSIKNAIKFAISDDKKYRNYVRQFTWDSVAMQLLEIYNKIYARKKI